MRPSMIAAAAVAALAAVPSTAAASSLTYEGGTLVVRAAPGEANFVTLSGGDTGRIAVSDAGALTFPGDRCTQLSPDYPAQCDLPGAVRVELGDGNDNGFVMHDVPAIPITYDGGPGADQLKAAATSGVTFLGGDGKDELTSEGGNDVLHGGEGDDTVIGGAGDDQVFGDGGDDLLKPDNYTDGNDLVDGGPGFDQVDDWADNTSANRGKRVTITMDGIANDGRPGEADNVVGVEFIKAFAPGSYSMTEGPDRVESYAPSDLGPSTIAGLGGDDVLLAGNGSQTIDGGAGNDQIEGGFGDDVLTGGPGRDTIAADFTGSQCGVLQSCTLPHGDDVVYARDGESDTIDCGVGTDRAVVDAVDTVSNCETVERAGAAGATTGTAPGPDATSPAAAKIALARKVRLRTALTRGLKLRVSGLRAGAKVTVRAKRGKKTVATGRGKATAKGVATVTLKFTKAARRSLARKRSVKLTITAGKATRTLTLKR